MHQPIVTYPELTLTDEEREFVGHYATATRPGVLRRTYGAQLQASNIQGEPTRLDQLVTFSGRRIRLFGMTFSGDVSAWKIALTSPAGTQYTNGLVSLPALLNSQEDITGPVPTIPQYDSTATGALVYLSQPGTNALLFDPSIVIEGTDALQISGAIGEYYIARAQNQSYLAVLNVALHVWEFPEWPRMRPIVDNGVKRHGRVRGEP